MRWGLSATILAPTTDILRFAAYHLEAGAHRLYIYLDDDNQSAYQALKAHPKVRVQSCTADWWDRQNQGRPKKHQVRQTVNATHAYHRKAEVDWLIHMDVDEFLVCDTPVADVLASVTGDTRAVRVRPMEVLAGDGTAFKKFIPNGPSRAATVAQLYPTFGAYLNGGFLSHLAGKIFVRTGLSDVRVQIHNAFAADLEIPAETPSGIDLAHLHAPSWDHWFNAFAYRQNQGSYRPGLKPNRPRDKGGLSMHELFDLITAEDPNNGLKSFFAEVCADTPDLRARLDQHGLLRQYNLKLHDLVGKHFPTATL